MIEKRGNDGALYFAGIENGELVLGRTYGSPFTEMGTSCSLKEFLAGSFHDVLRNDMGEDVLRQLLDEAAQQLKLG